MRPITEERIKEVQLNIEKALTLIHENKIKHLSELDGVVPTDTAKFLSALGFIVNKGGSLRKPIWVVNISKVEPMHARKLIELSRSRGANIRKKKSDIRQKKKNITKSEHMLFKAKEIKQDKATPVFNKKSSLGDYAMPKKEKHRGIIRKFLHWLY